jgi:serine/threonine protein kinase
LNLTNNLYKFIKDDKKELYWANFIDINDLSEEFKDLYFKMVACAPKKRPSIEEIYNHEWMKEIRDLNDEELEKYNQELINEFKSREEKMNKQTN